MTGVVPKIGPLAVVEAALRVVGTPVTGIAAQAVSGVVSVTGMSPVIGGATVTAAIRGRGVIIGIGVIPVSVNTETGAARKGAGNTGIVKVTPSGEGRAAMRNGRIVDLMSVGHPPRGSVGTTEIAIIAAIVVTEVIAMSAGIAAQRGIVGRPGMAVVITSGGAVGTGIASRIVAAQQVVGTPEGGILMIANVKGSVDPNQGAVRIDGTKVTPGMRATGPESPGRVIGGGPCAMPTRDPGVSAMKASGITDAGLTGPARREPRISRLTRMSSTANFPKRPGSLYVA